MVRCQSHWQTAPMRTRGFFPPPPRAADVALHLACSLFQSSLCPCCASMHCSCSAPCLVRRAPSDSVRGHCSRHFNALSSASCCCCSFHRPLITVSHPSRLLHAHSSHTAPCCPCCSCCSSAVCFPDAASAACPSERPRCCATTRPMRRPAAPVAAAAAPRSASAVPPAPPRLLCPARPARPARCR